VKVCAVIAGVVLVLVVVVKLTGAGGEHGPGRHTGAGGVHSSAFVGGFQALVGETGPWR
jgi:hypothetical protein